MHGRHDRGGGPCARVRLHGSAEGLLSGMHNIFFRSGHFRIHGGAHELEPCVHSEALYIILRMRT